MKRSMLLFLLLLTLILGLSFNIHSIQGNPGTVHVDGSNITGPWDGSPEHPFQNITSGLAYASPGDTVYVHNGTYYEHLVIDKPVFLIGENEFDTIIDGKELGTIIKVAASNVTIKGFTIQNVGLWHYTLSGIDIENVNNTNVSHNIIEVSYKGIYLASSCNNIFTGNDISKTIEAVIVIDSNNTIFRENTLSDNQFAMVLNNANNNTIFHNNFMNNANFVSSINSTNLWDNGAEGNYWSNYTGKDEDQDGIGDSPYVINAVNKDNYPLMGALTDFAVTYENETQEITMICNSTVSQFNFNATFRMLSFNVTTYGGAAGFCRITIPQVLSASPYIVLIDDEQVNATLLHASNATNAFLYLAYNRTTQEVKVISKPGYELLTEYNALLEDFNKIDSKYYQLLADYKSLNQTLQLALTNYTGLMSLYDTLNETYTDTLANYTKLQEQYSLLVPNYTQLLSAYNTLSQTYSGALNAYSTLLDQFNELKSAYDRREAEYATTRTVVWFLSAATVAIAITTSSLVLKYRKISAEQKETVENYKTQLERINLLDAARTQFETDVQRRTEKIQNFEEKYGITIRPRGSLNEVIKSLELKKKKEGQNK